MTRRSALGAALAALLLGTATLPSSPAGASVNGSAASGSRAALTASVPVTARAVAGRPAAASVVQSVWAAVNYSRAQAHLPALRWSLALQQSARAHNVRMAATNTLSHQLSGEPSLGSRISARGVRWTWAAENIGWTTNMSRAGALAIESAMLNERAPNDGHRRNILSPTALYIGIDVVYDDVHHKLWLTEDFARY